MLDRLKTIFGVSAALVMAAPATASGLAATRPAPAAKPLGEAQIIIDGAMQDWPCDAEVVALEGPINAEARLAHAGAADLFVTVRADTALERAHLFLDLTGDGTWDRPIQLSFDGVLSAAQTRHDNAAAAAFSADHREIEWRVNLAKLGLNASDRVANIGFDIEAQTVAGDTIQLGGGEDKWINKRRLSRLWLVDDATRFGAVNGSTRWARAADRSPPQRVLVESLDRSAYRFETPSPDGSFAVSVPEGRYRLTALDSRTTRAHGVPVEITVAPGETARPAALTARPPTGAPASLASDVIAAENIYAIGLAHVEARAAYTLTEGVEADGDPAGDLTLFRMASISKPVAAMVVLKLVEAGLWSLDTPLADYVVPASLAEDPRSREVTSRMVLRHLSGLPNTGSGEPLAFVHDPGERQLYSGEAYYWMRDAVEAALDKRFQDLAEEHLFTPAGMMQSTFTFPPGGDQHYAGKLHGDFMFAPPDDWHEAKIVGGLLTTAGDLARFERYMLDGGGLSQALYQQMITPNPVALLGAEDASGQRFGLGWIVNEEPYLVLSHGGSERGARTFIALSPEQDRALAVATNASGGLPAIRTLFHRLWLDEHPYPAIEAEFERWERFDR